MQAGTSLVLILIPWLEKMIEIDGKSYREIRCSCCRKLLGYEYVYAGRLLFICPRCGEKTAFEFKHLNTKANQEAIQSEFSVHNGSQKGD